MQRARHSNRTDLSLRRDVVKFLSLYSAVKSLYTLTICVLSAWFGLFGQIGLRTTVILANLSPQLPKQSSEYTTEVQWRAPKSDVKHRRQFTYTDFEDINDS